MVNGDLDSEMTPNLNMRTESIQDDADALQDDTDVSASGGGGLQADAAMAADPRTLGDLQGKAESPNKRQMRRNRILVVAGICLVVVLAVSAYLIVHVLIPEQRYRSAAELMSRGEYPNAISAYESLGSYKDSRDQITEGKYRIALKLMQDRDYPKAIAAFEALGEYSKSKANIVECNYLTALQLMKDQNYPKAIAAFETLGEYSESKTNILECRYLTALGLKADSKYDEAIALFTSISAYKDSGNKIKETHDALGMKHFSEGRYDQAIESFNRSGNYAAINDVYAKMADEALSKQQFGLATQYYKLAGKSDALTEVMYQQAIYYFKIGEYARCFQELSDYVGYSVNGFNIEKMRPYKDATSYFVLSAVIDYTAKFKSQIKKTDSAGKYVPYSLALYNSAKSIASFKNMANFLKDDAFFAARLVGDWSAANGANFYIVIKSDQTLRFGSNLPTYQGAYAALVDYGKTFSLGSNEEGWKPTYAFNLVDENTLAIYAYRTRETFILYRKAAPNSQNNVTPLSST